MNKYDYLIVGAGLFGSTFAHLAYKKLGAKCLVIDKRNHLGGNLYCETKYNIDIHKYGPHIFHTSNDDVWQFVTSLVKFNNFINQPLAYTNGKIYSLPFNMYTFNQLWGITKPEDAVKKINSEIAKKITFEQVQLMINLTKTYGIKFSSLVFEFLRILLDCYDELIPLILKEHNFILFAISKIPMDTAVDFLVQLLQYSNNNNIPDSVNLTKYFIENSYHHNLMKLFNSMIKFPHQQAQILKILKQLETIQNYPSDLYVNFIEHCQRLLEKLKFNEEDQIPLFEFQTKSLR